MNKNKLRWRMWLAHPIAVAIGLITWIWLPSDCCPPLFLLVFEMAFLLIMLLAAGRLEQHGNVKLFHWELLILMYIAAHCAGAELYALREGTTWGADDFDVRRALICIYLFYSHIFAGGILFGDGLCLAAGLNLTPVMKHILEKEKHRLNHRGANQNTALIDAAKYNRMKAVRLLLDHGAERDLTNIHGKTAADYALENGNHEMYQLLTANPRESFK